MDFNPPFANAGGKRAPTSDEITNGFPCGPLDRDLWNWLVNSLHSEVNGPMLAAGLTPSNASPQQLLEAILILSRGRSVVFTTPGTSNWTVPANITRVRIKLWGAGGGGGAARGGTGQGSGSGGGGAGYGEGSFTVSAGNVIAVTVGAGGNGGFVSGTVQPATAGGSSSFGAFITATGGQAGAGGDQTNAGLGGTGGGSTGGEFSSNGQAGMPGGSLGGVSIGGWGGGTFSTPQTAFVAATSNGSGASTPGGGGGGAAAGTGQIAAGALGARGLVIVQY